MTRQVHPDAFQPLSDDEFGAVCEAADHMTVNLGRGWAARPTPNFAGQLVRFWGRTGIHPSMLGRLGPANLRDDILVWNRPKTRQRVEIPVHHTLLPWVADFLRTPKPKDRRSYHRLLKQIEAAIEETEGTTIHLNGMRFRHFCARSLLELGLDPVIVARMMRVSMRTLEDHYGALSPEAIREKVRSLGF